MTGCGGVTNTCFSLCTQSTQMHLAKTSPILPPLRDTLFMEPPASSSLAHLSGTSQARACSEVSSAGAESVRARDRKMQILRVGRCRLSQGWPKTLRHIKHRVLPGWGHSSSTARVPPRGPAVHPAAVLGGCGLSGWLCPEPFLACAAAGAGLCRGQRWGHTALL